MSLAAKILAGDVKLIDAGREAQAMRQRLYLDERGRLVIAPRPLRPGWVRIAVKVKSPTEACLEPQRCAA
ncbi:MAG: hypothetical protein AB1409_08315 [Pseudomonadota bacterium]